MVENYKTCSSFVVSLELAFGCTLASITIGNFTHTFFNTIELEAGVSPLVICCEVAVDFQNKKRV